MHPLPQDMAKLFAHPQPLSKGGHFFRPPFHMAKTSCYSIKTTLKLVVPPPPPPFSIAKTCSAPPPPLFVGVKFHMPPLPVISDQSLKCSCLPILDDISGGK